MEEDFRARLQGDAALAAISGSRVDWGLRPQGDALPAITLTVASAPGEYLFEGRNAPYRTRVQVDLWALNYSEIAAMARRLQDLVEPGAIVGATRFDRSFKTIDVDSGAEDLLGGADVQRRIIEFTVWHRPAA